MLSIITNLLNLSFYYLILLWLGLLIIILYIFFQEKRQQSSLIKEELKESKTLFRMYIDRFFIVSKIKTFSLCSIYIFGNSLLFILIRYMYLGQITPLIISPVTSNLWLLIFIYIKLGITIILYKILLDVLFGSEINKLYLYIIHNRWYWKYVSKLLSFRLGEYLIGCLRVPCYRIATFTYQGEYISGNLPQFIHNDELNYHIQNDIIIRIIKKMQDLAIQYRIIKELFAVLAYILRFFHIHINGINEHLPYLILFIIFVIEFQNKQFRYIYIASFIFLLIKSKRDIVRFSQKRVYMYDANLSRYFYSNDIDYKIQRTSFYKDNKIAIDTNKYSYQNNAIDNNYPKIVDYIFNNFKSSSYPTKFRRRIAGVYRRFLLTLTIVSIAIYLLIYKSSMYHIEALVFVNIPLIVLFIPVLVMIYCSYKTYYPKSYKEDPTDAEWIYNRKHNIIFWIVTVMQLYIFWILLFKPELIFADTEVLFNYIITITKTYTMIMKPNCDQTKNNLRRSIICSNKIRTLMTLNKGHSRNSKGTYLVVPLSIKIYVRFSSKKPPKPQISSTGPKPIAPSSLRKPLPQRGELKPMPPKHYNHNNIGGMKPKVPYDPSKDSYLAKPSVVWALQQQGHASASNIKPSASVSGNVQNCTTRTTTTTQSASNLNTTSIGEPLASVTGALAPYISKPKNTIPIQYNYSTILIDTEGIAYRDHGGTSFPTDPKSTSSEGSSKTFSEEPTSSDKPLYPPTTTSKPVFPKGITNVTQNSDPNTLANMTTQAFSMQEVLSAEESLITKAIGFNILQYKDAITTNPLMSCHNKYGALHWSKDGVKLYKKNFPPRIEIHSQEDDAITCVLECGILNVDPTAVIPFLEHDHIAAIRKDVKIYVFGYFTRKKNKNMKIADEKIDGTKEPQYCHPFENLFLVDETQYESSPKGTEYISKDANKTIMKPIAQDVCQKPRTKYTAKGLQREELEKLIHLCENKEDALEIKKLKHKKIKSKETPFNE